MSDAGRGASRRARIATFVVCALGCVAAIVAVIALHPWNRRVLRVTVHVVETDPAAHEALATRPSIGAYRQDTAPGAEVIRIHSTVRRQTIEGFGAAMSDSSAWLIEQRVPPAARRRVMGDLFGPTGIHLSEVLIPMAASDYTRTGKAYSYDDLPQGRRDLGMKRFHVAHDNAYILPALRAALALNDDISFIATPWSLPGWMKANHKLSNRGNAGTLEPADEQAYANYFAMFLKRYHDAGVSVGEVTPANEPGVATAGPGMNLPAATENTLIGRYLVPTMLRHGLATQVYGADLDWSDGAYARAIATGSAARAGDVDGIAWQCDEGSAAAMSRVAALNPRLGVQVTECAPGLSSRPLSESVIESLRNHATVVDLGNLALDVRGGPVQQPNRDCRGCFGLARIDTRTGAAHLTSAYDDLGQASKFIDPGARVLGSNRFAHGVDDVAVRNLDGSIVVLAYNTAPVAKQVSVVWDGLTFTDTIPAGATVTFHWKPAAA